MKDLNILKAVLAEQKKTGKWLAELLRKGTSTVFKWHSNKMQLRIAEILYGNIRELIIATKQ